ncbi:ribose-phosphate pyrophosphokinase-like domain-containing protein [Nonomuraea angiospora]|uniref:ribose-phosphate pyrophosphokinase-like domain-containing protein n=1 Tax=Nonomuraea angiospora TaxID=46172 RepID=UPI0033FB3AFF
MSLQIVAGTANRALADSVAEVLGNEPAPVTVERFPDGELRPTVDGLRGADVYLVQPTGPPVNEHVMELPLLVDACRRAGAARITAVMAAVEVVSAYGAAPEIVVAATHGLFVEAAAERLDRSGIHRVLVTDTVARPPAPPMRLGMCSVASLLADAIGRLHRDEPDRRPRGRDALGPVGGHSNITKRMQAITFGR